jgi:DNA gyrase subunit B
VDEIFNIDVNFFDLHEVRQFEAYQPRLRGIFPITFDHKGTPRTFHGPTDFGLFLLEQGRKGITVSRYKGLGEMNAEELWETTMNPENRVLMKVNIEDAENADAIFSKLMGDDVEIRKNFIQTRAKFVTDLDV